MRCQRSQIQSNDGRRWSESGRLGRAIVTRERIRSAWKFGREEDCVVKRSLASLSEQANPRLQRTLLLVDVNEGAAAAMRGKARQGKARRGDEMRPTDEVKATEESGATKEKGLGDKCGTEALSHSWVRPSSKHSLSLPPLPFVRS